MSVTVSQILLQQGYLNDEQYSYAYQIQQSQNIDFRQPLVQVYLENGFCTLEHIEYCLSLRQQYNDPEMQEQLNQQTDSLQHSQENVSEPTPNLQKSGKVQCSTCFSECDSSWSMCPFCGGNI